MFTKSCIFVKCLKQRSYIVIRRKIIHKWSFLILNTILYFLMLMSNWQFHLSDLAKGVGFICAISISFVCTGLLVWAFPYSQKLNLTSCLKSSLLLLFSFLLVCTVDQTQMHPSFIWPLGLFPGIIYNNDSLKEGSLEP